MLIEPQFRTDISYDIWSGKARLERMIAFEVELAAAQADCGLIPQAAADGIRHAGEAEGLDAGAIFEAARNAGNPAIPFAAAFTQHVASLDKTASRHVHFGATSQDVIDTAHMLALKATIAHMAGDLARALDRLKALALTYAETPIAARTLLQQATPITFGAKAAHWYLGLKTATSALEAARARDLLVQLAGASGTLAVLHPHGATVRARLAERLGLSDPHGNWQTARSPLVGISSAILGVVQMAAKIAGDIQFLASTEVGEVAETLRAGGGGSSAMPHKRNPVDSLVPVAALPIISGLVAALGSAGAQEQERSPGRWHAEWSVIPVVTTLALATTEKLADLLEGLTVDDARMRANLDRLDGLLASEALSSALAETIGRADAKALSGELVAKVRDERRHLRDIASSDARVTAILSSERLDAIFGYQDAIAAAAADARRIAVD
jgi:3-carboxy-cis,cis-muconate cycloisomerase